MNVTDGGSEGTEMMMTTTARENHAEAAEAVKIGSDSGTKIALHDGRRTMTWTWMQLSICLVGIVGIAGTDRVRRQSPKKTVDIVGGLREVEARKMVTEDDSSCE